MAIALLKNWSCRRYAETEIKTFNIVYASVISTVQNLIPVKSAMPFEYWQSLAVAMLSVKSVLWLHPFLPRLNW